MIRMRAEVNGMINKAVQNLKKIVLYILKHKEEAVSKLTAPISKKQSLYFFVSRYSHCVE